MLEIKLRRSSNGCLVALLSFFTGGLYFPYFLLRRWSERQQIARMDEAGFETLGGRRRAWGDIRHIQRTIRTVFGVEAYQTIYVYLDRGFVTLPTGNAVNAQEALEYFLAHIPAEARA